MVVVVVVVEEEEVINCNLKSSLLSIFKTIFHFILIFGPLDKGVIRKNVWKYVMTQKRSAMKNVIRNIRNARKNPTIWSELLSDQRFLCVSCITCTKFILNMP